MSKLSKLLKKPRLYIIDGFNNLYNNIVIKKFINNSSNYFKNIGSIQKVIVYTILGYSVLNFSYFYLIGRNRYIVNSAVVVRKSGDSNKDFSLSLLLGGGNQGSIEDAKYLEVYLKSALLLNDLEKEFDFIQAFNKKGIDIFSGIGMNSKREEYL